MERLFTCFVSSTFTDLQAERQRLVRVLLSNECVPFGMEFFPSAGKTQWPIIVEAIAHADFCIFVVAGRYGSISDEPPLSWTHREFREAARLHKPIVAIVHSAPEDLSAECREPEAAGCAALKDFRAEIEGATVVKYYRNEADLVEAAGSSIRYMQDRGQLTGWVRADGPALTMPATRPSQEPKLSLHAVVERVSPCWPIDADRIVANASREARELAETVRDHKPLRTAFSFAPGLEPSERDLAKAWERFEEALQKFEVDLGAWLADYQAAASRRSRRLTLALRIENAPGVAFAEGVQLEVKLPEGVRPAEDEPEVMRFPPEPPEYRRPIRAGYDVSALAGSDLFGSRRVFPKDLLMGLNALSSQARVSWAPNGVATLTLGSIHMGQAVDLKCMHLLAERAGTYELQCTLYCKAFASPLERTIELVVAEPEPRPAFTRLEGILEYPDVDLVEPNGEVVRPVRAADPPLEPPIGGNGSDVSARIRDRNERMRWAALGLEPAE